MDINNLERRHDPRTQTFLPITMRMEDSGEERAADLLDLSYGGAGIQTPAYNAPGVGDLVDLEFEVPDNDGGLDTRTRRETGIIVNVGRHDQGVRRLGVRFMQHPDIDCGLFDPQDLLADHRKMVGASMTTSRWETARNFDKLGSPQFATT
jgi:hypothetical protein